MLTPNSQVCQFPSTATQSEEQAAAERYVSGAAKAREAGNYAKALKKLQKGRAVLQQWGLESSLLCMHMGQVQAYYGEWTEAEAELKRGLDYQLSTSPDSELAVQLSTSLVELYHQRDLLEETVEQGLWILRTFAGSEHVFEKLRALYFLAEACYRLDEEAKGLALLEQWTEQLADSGPSQCVLFCTQAERLRLMKKDWAAAQLYERALEALPAGYLAAYAKHMLANCYQQQGRNQRARTAYSEALQTHIAHYPQSQATFRLFVDIDLAAQAISDTKPPFANLVQVYSAQFPQSLGLACCLSHLAQTHYRLYRKQKAEKFFIQAKAQFSAHFPATLEYADCLCKYAATQKTEEDEEFARVKALYLEAYRVSSAHLPQCTVLLKCLEGIKEEGLYQEIYEVYLTRFPQSRHFPTFLGGYYWFLVNRRLYFIEEQICEQVFPLFTESLPELHNFPKSLCNFTQLHKSLKNLKEAPTVAKSWFSANLLTVQANWNTWDRKEKLEKACEAFAAAGEPLYWFYAYCAHAEGKCYEEVSSWEKAAGAYLKACQAFAANDTESPSYGDCLQSVAVCYSRLNQQDSAQEYYLKACEVYAHIDTESKNYGDCLETVSWWYREQGRVEQAKEYFVKACGVFAATGSYSQCYAERLVRIAGWSTGWVTPEVTEKYYLQACQAFAVIDAEPQLYGECVHTLGEWYEKQGREEEAEHCYQQVCSIYSEDRQRLPEALRGLSDDSYKIER